jgi:hypothetical protein
MEPTKKEKNVFMGRRAGVLWLTELVGNGHGTNESYNGWPIHGWLTSTAPTKKTGYMIAEAEPL